MNFNVGPSLISPETYADIATFSEQKIGELGHRTEEFSAISQKSSDALRTYFSVPDDYTIVWGSSATELMELCIKSFVKKTSFHFTCGAFSERFIKIAMSFEKEALAQQAEWGRPNNFDISIPTEAEIITITQSETSTGVGVPMQKIADVKEKLREEQLLIVDTTSIMGAVPVQISAADCWLFSVQKCFGLPPGLGVLIFNEKALAVAKTKPNPTGMINLPAMAKIMQSDFQTTQTPNTLGIYLLGEQVARWNQNGGMHKIFAETVAKNKMLYELIDGHAQLQFLTIEIENRSASVNCLIGEIDYLKRIRMEAEYIGMQIGTGYGKLKDQTIRAANFPNLTMTHYQKLVDFLSQV